MHESVKSVIFYGVFAIIILMYALIYGTHYAGYSDVSGQFIKFILSSAPYVSRDLSLAGELTPPILAGVMSATIPQRSSATRTLISFVLALLCYGMYLHLSVFLTSPQAVAILQSVNQDPRESVSVLSAFSGGVRTFSAIIAASVIGLRINKAAEG